MATVFTFPLIFLKSYNKYIQSSYIFNFPLNVNLDDRTKTTSSILCQHVKSLDLKSRQASFIEKLPADLLEEVLNIIHSEF